MSLFRCAGDIIFDNREPRRDVLCDVKLKSFSETSNILQYLKPLTPKQPYFFAKIHTLAPKSKITLGIAGPDIPNEARPGNWINSVGCQSDTGACFTSHRLFANTSGEKFTIGDVFGVLVTYFSKTMSTVIFLRNGVPVATRYLFQSSHKNFLPTISLQYGPIHLGLMWPEAVVSIPFYNERNFLHWIRPPDVVFDLKKNIFHFIGKGKEGVIQSPVPLSTVLRHFEVIVQEVSGLGAGPDIALATCSPLIPSPTGSFSKDYLRFHPNGSNVKLRVGQRMGWGIHYNSASLNQQNFDPLCEQLVLCYVTLDSTVIHVQLILQPPGGFFPIIILKQNASKVIIDVESKPTLMELAPTLVEKFGAKMDSANMQIEQERLAYYFHEEMFHISKDIWTAMMGCYLRVHLPAKAQGIHVLQFLSPLTPTANYYFCLIRKLHENSVLSIGVAGVDMPPGKHPGRFRPSVGWNSQTGKLFRNDRSDGNLVGHPIFRGDSVGLEIETFSTEMSVVLFTRNFRPVGTVYYTQSDHSQFFPTIGLCSNGHEIEIDINLQNMNGGPPIFNVMNVEEWCLPPGAEVNETNNIVTVKDHITPIAIQAPYSLNKGYNHFEMRLIDNISPDKPPPAIVLSTATPLEPTPMTNFKLDFLRFWAMNDPNSTVKKGDLIGWGVLYLDDQLHHDDEQLVICYLTVNRSILLVRVLYQPPGGFFPLVILPPGVNQVQLEFGASIINEHPITTEDVRILMRDAEEMIVEEMKAIARGQDPLELNFDDSRLFRSLPSAQKSRTNNIDSQSRVKDKRVEFTGKTDRNGEVVLGETQAMRNNVPSPKRLIASGSVSCIVL